MMKKIFLIVLFFVSSCGYQPIYVNNTTKNYEFKKIIFSGDNYINKKIINILSIKENDKIENKNELFLLSSYNIEEVSKNSKGQVELYKSTITLNLKIKNINNETVRNKDFVKEFTYNTKQNKFDLTEYQRSIKDNLINEIINDTVIFLNLE